MPAIQEIHSQAVVRPNLSWRVFPATGEGIAVEVWDKRMVSLASVRAIKSAGFSVIRYPGGSYSDIYHWATATSTAGTGANVQPHTDFHSFMKLVQATGTTPLITVNYGSNPQGTAGASPSEAAAWVRDANVLHHWNVKYWEIGNEIYGNGFYNDVDWEEDLHYLPKGKSRAGNPALSPTAYGSNVVKFSKAMKKVDPNVKVGAVLCAPGQWPDGLEPDWNRHVLMACGKSIDFVVIHVYGEGNTPTRDLASINKEPAMMATLRKLINLYCGKHAQNVQIWITEGDSGGFNCVPTGADYAADSILTYLESGASSMDWWDLRNGIGVNRDPKGPMGPFNDQGILSVGGSKDGVSEPPVNTPFPAYFGLAMIHQLAAMGDKLVAANSSDPRIKVFASKDRTGEVKVMLIDESPVRNAAVELNVDQIRHAEEVNRVDYLAGASKLSDSMLKFTGPELTVHLQPFQITVLKFHPH